MKTEIPTIILIGNGNGVGGAQTAFRQLTKILLEKGVLQHVISIGEFPHCKDSRLITNIVTIPYNSLTLLHKIKKFYAIFRSALLIRRVKPKIIFSVGINRTAAFLFRWAPSSTFRCCQDYIHDRDINDPILAKIVSELDGFVAQTKTMHGSFRRNGFTFKNFSWLPCFAEEPVADVHVMRQSPKWNVKLCYFGRIAANKGVDLAIRALSSEKYKDVNLDIWGTGDSKDLIDLVKLLGVESRVAFCGPYPTGSQGAKLMVQYDGLVLTSTRTEGLPLVLLEAMAYGLPLLISNVGSMAEVAKNNPDVILTEPNLPAIHLALAQFVDKIRVGAFDSLRQRAYHCEYFSNVVFCQMWNNFLLNPEVYFSKQP